MTNLNIAVPADSKDIEFGTSYTRFKMNEFLDKHGLEVLWDKIKKADALKADKTALDTTNNTVKGILDGDKPLVNPVIASASW